MNKNKVFIMSCAILGGFIGTIISNKLRDKLFFKHIEYVTIEKD